MGTSVEPAGPPVAPATARPAATIAGFVRQNDSRLHRVLPPVPDPGPGAGRRRRQAEGRQAPPPFRLPIAERAPLLPLAPQREGAYLTREPETAWKAWLPHRWECRRARPTHRRRSNSTQEPVRGAQDHER